MSDLELLVGAEAFWRRARQDIGAARQRLFVQAMTFEGDAAGRPVAAAIAASPAEDRRVLVDSYSRHVISDRFIHAPAALLDGDLRAEVRATRAMFGDMAKAGARVRLTNPAGPVFLNWPARNHKKLIVADDVAYLGGINFSDHNFAWHDFMIRLEGEAAVDLLAGDFEATFAGVPRPWRADLGDLQLISLDGRSNARGFAPIVDLIDAARSAITVISPYLTFPFTGALARTARRGVPVRLITPLANNKPLVRDAMLASVSRAGFEVRLLPEMSHLKALLVDDERLVVGSSNFDFVSLAAEEELMAVIAAPALIADFHRRIVEPALAAALPPGAHRPSPLAGWASGFALRLADRLIQGARRASRSAVDWRG
ncbi:MAG: phosphatidylserine/phosphatidylglycerophosphate/cardiolipin synthase family protein [Caulobacteraceae bacterium]